jgi:iron complex outermembrane receptor protein
MRRKLLIGACLLPLFGWAHVAAAQTGVAPAADQSGTVGEVIVTAQRRAQNLQDVPIAITSFSQKDLAVKQIEETSDIPRLVPNFFTNHNTGTGSGNEYFLRGLGQNESFPTYDPQVATYVDDIYIGRGSANNFGLFDVDQVQVLRGPQGTLFGRNATGGAIVINTNQPGKTFGGYVEGSYGSYNGYDLRAAVDLPINDQILTRTAAFRTADDGYVHDTLTGQKLNGHDDYGVRESIVVKPANLSNVTWRGNAEYGQEKYNSNYNTPIDGKRVTTSGYGDASAPIPAVNDPGSFDGDPNDAASPQKIIADISHVLKEPFNKLVNDEDLLVWGAVSNFEIALPGGKLNVISGLRGQRQLSNGDFPGFSPPPFDENILGSYGLALNSQDREWTQELKWTGNFGKLTYTTGLFYLYEENITDYLQEYTYPDYVNFLDGGGNPTAVAAYELNTPEHFRNTTHNAAAYAQGDYAVTDQLSVTVGLRFTNEIKDFKADGNLAAGGYDTAAVNAAGYPTHLHTNQVTPRFAVQYKVDSDLMVFASATRGFQGGGWNSLSATASEVNSFGPETLWTYETGVRSEWLDKRLRVNADLFYNEIDNYQLITLGPASTPGTPAFATLNAANMITYGLEADISYVPIDHLTLSGTLGLQHGFYYRPSALTQSQQATCKGGNSAYCLQGIVNVNGNLATPQDLPSFNFTLNAVYDWYLYNFKLTPTAAVQYVQREHIDTQGDPENVSKSHMLVDLGLTFKFNNQPWSVTVECKNCNMANYETVDISSPSGGGLDLPYYNTPGTWDVKLRYPF